MRRRTLGWILLAALTGASGVVRAQTARPPLSVPATAAASAALVSERQRLRVELDRVNGEIDALKRDSRGVRDDYRLRNRMADAEALARRLTDLDARLRAAAVPSTVQPQRDPAASWTSPPEAKPTDDRAALEAKADILADQARRLNTQVNLLSARVTDLRARHELRRRAGQLERDPFSALEQAKRRLATSGPSGDTGSGKSGPTFVGQPTSDTARPPPEMSTTIVGPGTQPTGAPTTGFTGGPAGDSRTAVSATAGSVYKAQPSLLAPGSAGDTPAGSVATQFRGMLDASTLAEIRRLEIAGSPDSSLSAMERALSALRARAAQLTNNAAVLRSRAQTNP
ncbi:MAG: hypothetical protein H7X95_12610 [Deltaproteobacteria bacterium]|nr:hypothetical protein [Deltaproteobacteria bacterium]